MSDFEQIIVEKREISGTGNSRLVRSKGQVPGIIYGEKKEPILIKLDGKLLRKHIQKSGFFSNQLELKIDNVVHKVLPKDIQLHPVKESIIHLDFLRVGENTMVTVSVPVKFKNENLCEGIKKGGVINIVRHDVEIKSPVNKIPEELEINLEGLDIGDSIHISSVNLDKDVKPTITDRDFTIATIAPPTVVAVEEEKSQDGEGEDKTDEKGDEKIENDSEKKE